MTDVIGLRLESEVTAIEKHPQDYGEGVLKGAEVYEQGHKFEYIAKLADRNVYRKDSASKGSAYTCGLWEGWHEAEQNDVNIKQAE